MTSSERDDVTRQLTHDRLVDRFDALMDEYDVNRRTETLLRDFLSGVDLAGRRALDGGCGVGGLTVALQGRGARVVALDIGEQLAREAHRRLGCAAAVGSLLHLPFAAETFDVVLSSEVIEHTPDPEAAARELYRVLKPGGHMVLSTPNRLWQFPVRLASRLGLRPYDGYENFLRPSKLRRAIASEGGVVVEHRGLHLWPFQIRALRPLSRRVDRFGRALLPLMINQCLHARKPAR